MKSSDPLVLVYEFCCGGGVDHPAADMPMVSLGWTMLRSVLEDMRKWERVRTVSMLHHELRHLVPPADQVVFTSHVQSRATLASLLAQADAALIIAPEAEDGLADLSSLAFKHGAKLLGSSPEGVREAGDKWRCYKRLAHAGISTPPTQRLKVKTARESADGFSYPVVIKPRHGAGCQGVHRLNSASELRSALAAGWIDDDSILVQPYLHGKHLSVSCLVSSEGIRPICLNRQKVHMGSPCCFLGCEILRGEELQARAFALAEDALAGIEGLCGFVGLDLVWSDGELYVIEINPRITMAYVNLSKAVNINLAQQIWRAAHGKALAQDISLSPNDEPKGRL